MAIKTIYHDTYWNKRGKHPELNDKLFALLPDTGEVENVDANHALEKFRVACQCYYDLYNDGLCNRAEEFERVFGITLPRGEDEFEGEIPDVIELTPELVKQTEAAMNKIILAAAKEQKLK